MLTGYGTQTYTDQTMSPIYAKPTLAYKDSCVYITPIVFCFLNIESSMLSMYFACDEASSELLIPTFLASAVIVAELQVIVLQK